MVDPSVQLAYSHAAHEKWWRRPRPETQRTVVSAQFDQPAHSDKTWRCCELGETAQHIDWAQCHRRNLSLPATFAQCRGAEGTCLGYDSSRWEQAWPWRWSGTDWAAWQRDGSRHAALRTAARIEPSHIDEPWRE